MKLDKFQIIIGIANTICGAAIAISDVKARRKKEKEHEDKDHKIKRLENELRELKKKKT